MKTTIFALLGFLFLLTACNNQETTGDPGLLGGSKEPLQPGDLIKLNDETLKTYPEAANWCVTIDSINEDGLINYRIPGAENAQFTGTVEELHIKKVKTC